MKRILLVASAVLAVPVSLGGCASVSPSDADPDRGIDLQKVSAVDHAARGRSLEIHWINYPTRKVAEPAATPAPDGGTGT